MTALTVLGLLLAHFAGDYLLQTDHMAAEKTRRWSVALLHAGTYGLPFLLVTRSPAALAVIVVTHAVIDRYRLAAYVCWAKNQLAPRAWRYPWSHTDGTGYHTDAWPPYVHGQNTAGCTAPGKPVFMAVWLMIVVDNLAHLTINAAAVLWL